jgi:hypothetical protein
MEEVLKDGTSINNHSLSEQDTTTNLGISRVVEEQEICKYGAQTLDGSKFSSMKKVNSSTGKTVWHLMLLDQEMMKVLL